MSPQFFSAGHEKGLWRTPVVCTGSAKYSSGAGGFTDSLLPAGVPDSWNNQTNLALNTSLSRKAWEKYKVPLNHLARANSTRNLGLSFPFLEEDTFKYTQYLLFEDNPCIKKVPLEPSTVRAYLAGIRQAHITQGMPPPKRFTPMVELLLRGQENVLKEARDRGEKDRWCIAITWPLLNLLRGQIADRSWSSVKKNLLLAVSAVAWSGSKRIGELLTECSGKFDPASSLLARDVLIEEVMLEDGKKFFCVKLYIKARKENRISGIWLEIVEVGGDNCPVVAGIPTVLKNP